MPALFVFFAMAIITVGAAPAQQQTGTAASPPQKNGDAAGTVPSEVLHYRVRVIDGRNGMPIPNAHVTLWYDEPAGPGYAITTDTAGVANMPAPAGEPTRVLVSTFDYSDCRKPVRGDPQPGYSLDAITRSGALAENSCGLITARPKPGELILFARPQRWFERLNRGNGN